MCSQLLSSAMRVPAAHRERPSPCSRSAATARSRSTVFQRTTVATTRFRPLGTVPLALVGAVAQLSDPMNTAFASPFRASPLLKSSRSPSELEVPDVLEQEEPPLKPAELTAVS